jgi:hypothetical protein
MIRKQKGRVKSGIMVVHLATKKRKSHSKIKIMLIGLIFFGGGIFEEWSITNLFHRVKQLMTHFMRKF